MGPIRVGIVALAVLTAVVATRWEADATTVERAAAALREDGIVAALDSLEAVDPSNPALSPTGSGTADVRSPLLDQDPIDVEAIQRGAEALAAIEFPWRDRLPGWTIEFVPADDPAGPYGHTYTRQSRITIFVRPDQPLEHLARVIAHELGHAVDVSLLDETDRSTWREARGFDEPWWPDSGATDFATGAGDFAEAFAVWQVGPVDFRSEIASAPDPAHLDLLATIIDRQSPVDDAF